MHYLKAARSLLDNLPIQAGKISVSVWFDREQPYLKVCLAPDVAGCRDTIPSQYKGYDVVVSKMPEFELHI